MLVRFREHISLKSQFGVRYRASSCEELRQFRCTPLRGMTPTEYCENCDAKSDIDDPKGLVRSKGECFNVFIG